MKKKKSSKRFGVSGRRGTKPIPSKIEQKVPFVQDGLAKPRPIELPAQHSNEDPQFLTVRQIAELLQLDPAKLYAAIRKVS